MIELKISGANPQELYTNAATTLAWLLQGAQAVQQAGQETALAASPVAGASVEAVPLANPSAADAPPVEVKTRRPRAAQTVDVKPTPAAPLVEETAPAPMAETAAVETKKLTIDDIRARTAAIMDAHTKRGNEMPACMDYVRDLFKPFGIKKAVELPVERWAEYMAKSEDYLAGTVVLAKPDVVG